MVEKKRVKVCRMMFYLPYLSYMASLIREPPVALWLVENNRNIVCSAPCSGTRTFSEFPQVATRKKQLYTKSNTSKNKTKKNNSPKYIPLQCQQCVRMLGCSVSPSSFTRPDSFLQSSLHSLEKCLINLIAFSFPFSRHATTKPLK